MPGRQPWHLTIAGNVKDQHRQQKNQFGGKQVGESYQSLA
jgi:hypothetical protein